MRTTWIEIEDDEGVPHAFEVSVIWDICPECNGHGTVAMGGQAFTQSEFNDCFDDVESKTEYFTGGYDTLCRECEGNGKVPQPNVSELPKEWQEHYEAQLEAEAYYASLSRHEKRYAEQGWTH